MGWSRCPRCGFTQIASKACLRCGEPLPRPVARPVRPAPAGEAAAVSGAPRRVWPFRVGLAGGAFLLILVLMLWLRGSPSRRSMQAAPASSPSDQTALNLGGRWYGQISKALPETPPRPVLKEATIETNGNGAIVAARVVLTDPGRGGAGAGYRMAPDGPQRIADTVSALAVAREPAPVNVDFVILPPWMPVRARLWRALEGINRRRPQVRYLLLESVEEDYLMQAGINDSGFLSYAFFSPAYAPTRGVEALSQVIHPAPGSSLAGFRNLVWDLSGSVDFLTQEIRATLTGPDGTPDRIVLKR